jgi:hypothetical protein
MAAGVFDPDPTTVDCAKLCQRIFSDKSDDTPKNSKQTPRGDLA